MRVGLLGNSHVGLITCLSLASIGHEVIGYDVDESKIEQLEQGVVHFYEPRVPEALKLVLSTGRLRFTSLPEEALQGAVVVFICVGTPPREDGETDLAGIESAAREIARSCSGRGVVAQKSTVPVSTSEWIERLVAEESRDVKVAAVVSNPEFLREGSALDDAMHPSRIVVGSDSAWANEVMRALYASIVESGAAFIETDRETAELSKLACNAFLALRISFANALARVSELSGADVVTTSEIMGKDPESARPSSGLGWASGATASLRTSRPWRGWPRASATTSPCCGRSCGSTTRRTRPWSPGWRGCSTGSNTAASPSWAWRSSRTPTTSGRHRPCRSPLPRRRGGRRGLRPPGGWERQEGDPELELAENADSAAAGADCLVLCPEWPVFRGLDLSLMSALMAGSAVVDGRNFLDPAEVAAAGLSYYPVGRPNMIVDRTAEASAPLPSLSGLE